MSAGGMSNPTPRHCRRGEVDTYPTMAWAYCEGRFTRMSTAKTWKSAYTRNILLSHSRALASHIVSEGLTRYVLAQR